jgi:hypothetical protein
VLWISNILRNNQDLADKKLEVNTIDYLENLTRKYTFRNREKIKRTKGKKDKLLLILDYLIKKGSDLIALQRIFYYYLLTNAIL